MLLVSCFLGFLPLLLSIFVRLAATVSTLAAFGPRHAPELPREENDNRIQKSVRWVNASIDDIRGRRLSICANTRLACRAPCPLTHGKKKSGGERGRVCERTPSVRPPPSPHHLFSPDGPAWPWKRAPAAFPHRAGLSACCRKAGVRLFGQPVLRAPPARKRLASGTRLSRGASMGWKLQRSKRGGLLVAQDVSSCKKKKKRTPYSRRDAHAASHTHTHAFVSTQHIRKFFCPSVYHLNPLWH